MTYYGPPSSPWAPPPPEPSHSKPWWRSKWLLVISLALVLGAAGAAFVPLAFRSSPLRAATSPAAVGSGYLASARAGVFFIQWTDTGNDLSGTAHLVVTTGVPPAMKLQTETLNVVGRIRGSTLVLSFDGGPDVFGTFATSRFTINIPQGNGVLAPGTFRAATVAAYNAALAKLRSRVDRVNAEAVAAQQLSKLKGLIATAASHVNADIAALSTSESTLTKAVDAIPGALQKEAQDLAVTESAEQKVLASIPTTTHGTVCSEVGTVRSDAGTVRSDAGTVRSDAGTVKVALDDTFLGTGLEPDLSALKTTFAQFQKDALRLPSYHVATAPTTAEVTHAESAASAAMATALATTNGYISEANADVLSADQYAAQAARASGCTTELSTWTPVQPIT